MKINLWWDIKDMYGSLLVGLVSDQSLYLGSSGEIVYRNILNNPKVEGVYEKDVGIALFDIVLCYKSG